MALRQKIETATTTVLTVGLLAVTLMMVCSQFFPTTARAGELKPQREKEWQKYAVGDMRIGPADAAVTITEFSDFQCQFCYRLYRSLESIRSQHANDVAIVYRNYPLEELHPFAKPAAIAVECAAQQGRFAEYYRFLFDHQDSLKNIGWTSAAHQLGVADTSAFAACLTSPAILAKLTADSLAASALRIPGTPLVLVNSWVYRGAPTKAALDTVVAKELAKSAR